MILINNVIGPGLVPRLPLYALSSTSLVTYSGVFINISSELMAYDTDNIMHL